MLPAVSPSPVKPGVASLDWAQGLTLSRERLAEHVTRLNYPRNRLDRAPDMLQAEAYLTEVWSHAGWQVSRGAFTVDETLLDAAQNLTLDQRRRLPGAAGANLIAYRPGLEERVILVGAHLDTLTHTSGADDNTSGVAALLELARILAPHRFRSGVALVAFDMEEWNLLGSRSLVRSLPWSVEGALVLECVGYYSDEPHSQSVPPGLQHLFPKQWKRLREGQFRGDFSLVIYRAPGENLARRMVGALQAVAGPQAALLLRDPADLPLVGSLLGTRFPFLNNLTRSDHSPFWDQGIPALMVTDTAEFRNPYYHTAEDLPHRLDYGRMAQVVRALAVVLADVAGLIPSSVIL